MIESQEQLKQTISALRLRVQNKDEQIASKNRELQELKKALSRKQTAPARAKKNEKDKKAANRENRITEAKAKAAITRDDIRLAKRRRVIYNKDTKTYTEQSSFVHTLESAKLTLDSKGIEYKEIKIWVTKIPDREVKQDIPILRMLSNGLNNIYKDSLEVPKEINASDTWTSLIYRDGSSRWIFPLPPPVNYKCTPCIKDCDWEKVLNHSLHHDYTRNFKQLKQIVGCQYTPLDAGYGELECRTDWDVPHKESIARQNLRQYFIKLGMSDILGDYQNDELDKFIIEHGEDYIFVDQKAIIDPIIEDAQRDHYILLDIFKSLAVAAFEAGEELQKEKLSFNYSDMQKKGLSFTHSKTPKKAVNKILEQIITSYSDKHPTEKITASTIVEFVDSTDCKVWKQALTTSCNTTTQRYDTLSGVIKRYKEKQ